jgi:hypothetical protein
MSQFPEKYVKPTVTIVPVVNILRFEKVFILLRRKNWKNKNKCEKRFLSTCFYSENLNEILTSVFGCSRMSGVLKSISICC